MAAYLEGFFLSASLILALGAQNIFVLESGLRRRRHLLVALVCTVCDAFLIGVGVAGAATIFVRVPMLKIVFGFLGVAFLIYYGFQKLREGLKTPVPLSQEVATAHSFKSVLLLSLSFSLLNPHVYLDTVILIGGYASKFSDLATRARFGLGAASFSAIWFFGLALFAQALSRFLHNPQAMRVIALLSGLILLILSWKLGRDVLSWVTTH